MRLFAMLTIVAIAVVSPARAEEWQKTYAVEGEPALTLDADDARVEIRAWDRREVSVRILTEKSVGVGPDADLRVSEEQRGDAISVRVWRPQRRIRLVFQWRETTVEVRAPRNARLDVQTGDGSCDLSGIDGDIRIASGDGAIETDTSGGRMRLETQDGRIIVRRAHGMLSAHTGDGRIEADGVFSGLDLSSSDGSITAEVAPGSAVVEDWRLRTSDGRIRLLLPRAFDADIEARTNDGRIRLEVPAQGTVERRHASVRLGTGGNSVLLRSGDGSILVGQE